jgi:hypothetical protein
LTCRAHPHGQPSCPQPSLAEQCVHLADAVVGVLGVGVGADLVGPALRARRAADDGLEGQALFLDPLMTFFCSSIVVVSRALMPMMSADSS